MITLSELKELLTINESIPQGLSWKFNLTNRVKIGDPAGSLHKVTGYYKIGISGKIYFNHKIIYCLANNIEPIDLLNFEIDHRDRNKKNNSSNNLRITTINQNRANTINRKNNTTGFKGVYWNKIAKKYLASIRYNSKLIYLGYFNNKIDAAKSYNKKALELFGEYACLNDI